MAALDDDMDWLDENENAGPALKRKKAAAPKKKKAPLAALDANAVPDADGGKSIEQTYQKLSQLEHILLRPDTYVGSIERQQQQAWVLREPTALDGALDSAAAPIKFEHRTIDFVPGLYKIFDEILVNACDHRVRDATMDTLRVDFDPAQGLVRVFNNGKGIPVEMHKTEKVHVPELIFGHLLTSSNYNDGEKKLTGGRNGYGSKLTNIFSKEFVVETCDGERKRKYRQKFQNNMKQIGAPEISACKAKDNWTCVTFRPDLERFGLSNLSGDDTLALMRKRVVDAAGSLGKGVKVFLDGKKLPIASFQDYCNLYIGDPKKDGATAMPRVYERVNDRWEVCATMSEGQFNQVSFVNSICTLKGGTHANVVADQIASKLLGTKALKGHKKLKPFQVKNHVWVFVNALIENPAFDSQTKDFLTLKASAFGSKCELSDAFMKKFEKTGIVDNILSWANFKQSKELKKTDGSKKNRLTGIPKLDDANDAGGRNSEHCTLILTEGDSAKASAVSGLGVVGRDRFGVFPLRGKFMNVRGRNVRSHTQVMNNAEISHLKQILGLQHGKQYADTKSLRYGHLMIMTDQDHDGSHIKGLVINFLHHFFPSLVKMPGFLVEFITPIVKATRGKEQRIFYTLPEYEGWKETVGNQKWSIKYYKGLGTSTAKEAKEYFSELTRNSKQFVYNGHEDGQLIEMVFSKKHVDSRKQWLSDFRPGTFLDHSAPEIGFSDFINKELILFSRADLERSIPSVLDGFKPGQRKIMFCGFKRNLKSDIKVAQLAGYVSEHSAYHHGEQSLASTIVGLAQDYVGSNNVNILTPSGQFGTRLQGGKDSASPRYIYTRLGPLTRHIFKEDDDCLLNYLDEDGQSIEPEWYMPVLPMVLVNGADGIGTGWSTFIPNYNPRDIVANVKRYIDGMPMKPMVPWYKNFTGEINRIAGKSSSAGESFSVTGIINIIDDTTIEIVELPLRKWVQDYKEFLEGLIKPEKKDVKPLITDYKEYHTDTSVRFVITMPEENLAMAQETGLYKTFKLLTTMSTTNMHLFSSDGVIKKYDAPQAIIEEFCEKRLEFYDLRKQHKLKDEEEQMRRLDNKKRFILCVVNEEVVLAKQKKADIEARLDFLGFDRLTKTKKQGSAKGGSAADAGAGEEDGDAAEGSEGSRGAKLNFDYLLSMPLWSLSLEKVEELEREYEEKKALVATIKATKPTQIWVEDLDAFEEALASVEAEEQKQMAELQEQALKAQGKAAGKGKGKGRKAKAAPPPAQGVKVAPPIIEAKPTAARKAKAKKAAPKPSASAAGAGAGGDAPADASPIDVDSEDDFMPSLMERLASRKANSILDPEISAPGAPAAKKTTAAAAKKKAAPKRKPATKPAPRKAKACDAMEGVDGIEEEEEDVFMLDSPSPAAAPKAKASRRVSPVPMRAASTRPKKPTKKAVVLSDSDEESDYESDGDISYDDESDGDDSDFSCSD